MTNIINNTYNQTNLLHKTNLQNIHYLQSSLQNKNNTHNVHICLKDETHIISIKNKNNIKNKKYFHIYDKNDNNPDSVSISINKCKNISNNKKYNSNIVCIDNDNNNNSPAITIPHIKSKKKNMQAFTKDNLLKEINICIDDPNEITAISIPYIQNRVNKKRCNDVRIEISDLSNECVKLNIPTISINEKQYNILKQLDFFIKHKIIPDFVSPYNHKQYAEINKNIHNGLFDKYLCIADNKKYKKTYVATIVKETLHLIQSHILCDTENEELKQKIIALNKKIAELESRHNNKKSLLNIKTELKVDITIDEVYIIYIDIYGLPDDGVFEPHKLDHIRHELEEKHHHHHHHHHC